VPPRFHSLYSLIADGDQTRNDEPHQVRDGLAASQVQAVLSEQGYIAGRDILNFPPQPGEQSTELARIDTSMFRLRDVLCTCTRLPFSDHIEGCRKKVPRGETDLEQELIEEWQSWVSSGSRLFVQLNERLHDKLPAGFENRRRMKILEDANAAYNRLSRCDGSPPRRYRGEEVRTPFFKVRLPRLSNPARNFGYLGIWGMSGITTLIGACLLRHRHPELLTKPGFVMAELVGGPIPKRPFDLDWALDWRLEVLIDEPAPRVTQPRSLPPAGPRRPARSGANPIAI
jgi:hypothetical protein